MGGLGCCGSDGIAGRGGLTGMRMGCGSIDLQSAVTGFSGTIWRWSPRVTDVWSAKIHGTVLSAAGSNGVRAGFLGFGRPQGGIPVHLLNASDGHSARCQELLSSLPIPPIVFSSISSASHPGLQLGRSAAGPLPESADTPATTFRSMGRIPPRSVVFAGSIRRRPGQGCRGCRIVHTRAWVTLQRRIGSWPAQWAIQWVWHGLVRWRPCGVSPTARKTRRSCMAGFSLQWIDIGG